MKKLIVALLVINLTSTALATQDNLTEFRFSIDKDYSMQMGSDLFVSTLHGYKYLDDALVSSTESNKQVLMMFGRFGKFLIIDNLIAKLLSVTQHEIFGHGSRAREFNLDVSYEISPFKGKTNYLLVNYEQLHIQEKIALTAGGMEGDSILAYQLRNDWLNRGAMDNREATLYLASYLDQTLYALNTKHDSKLSDDNDVNNYVNLVNTWHGSNVTSLSKIRKRAVLDLLDPYLYYSIYNIINHIGTGSQTIEYKMLPIRGYEYLPSLRTIFAPWGLDYQLSNYIKTPSNKLIQVDLRYGKTNAKKSSAAMLKVNDIWSWNGFRFDLKGALWQQPKIFSASASTADNKMGFALSTTANYKVNPALKLGAQLGYKTAGHLQGETLKRSPIARVMVSFLL